MNEKTPSEREKLAKFLAAMAAQSVSATAEFKENGEITIIGGVRARIKGSVPALCACGSTVWLSPTTDAMTKRREGFPARILCVPCFARELEKGNQNEVDASERQDV